MAQETVELILWMLFVFFIGCIAGSLLRRAAVEDLSTDAGAPPAAAGGPASLGRIERSGTAAPAPRV